MDDAHELPHAGDYCKVRGRLYEVHRHRYVPSMAEPGRLDVRLVLFPANPRPGEREGPPDEIGQ